MLSIKGRFGVIKLMKAILVIELASPNVSISA